MGNPEKQIEPLALFIRLTGALTAPPGKTILLADVFLRLNQFFDKKSKRRGKNYKIFFSSKKILKKPYINHQFVL